MNIHEFQEGLQILSRYSFEYPLCAEHDQIYIYISIDSEPSEEDTYVLQELGFFKEHDDYPLLWSLCV